MIKYVVSWSFGAKYILIHIKNDVVVDKYTFSKSMFDETKYLEEKKKADSERIHLDDIHYGSISWELSIEDDSKIEEVSKNELHTASNEQ